MNASLLLVLVACDSGAPPKAETVAPRRQEPPVVDALPAAASIPRDLEQAPAQVFRRYYTGAATTAHVTVYTLREHDGYALLSIEKLTPIFRRVTGPVAPGTEPVIGWQSDSIARYVGTASADAISVTQVAGAEKLTLQCKPYRISAARPDAVRKPRVPPRPSCTGERGHFVPAATSAIQATYCYSSEPENGVPGDSEWNGYEADQLHAAFAPAPGVEWLWVNDDCAMQGGGFRKIAADGSIHEPK